MIYVYIKNWWIIKKSKDIVNWLSYDSVEIVDYKIDDRLICEKGKIVKYEDSELYKKDKWIIWVEEENRKLKEELKEKTQEYDKLSCDFLRLRAQYDLLRKRQITD
jgi:molecular chaperone GrpE (heat shock protein)